MCGIYVSNIINRYGLLIPLRLLKRIAFHENFPPPSECEKCPSFPHVLVVEDFEYTFVVETVAHIIINRRNRAVIVLNIIYYYITIFNIAL